MPTGKKCGPEQVTPKVRESEVLVSSGQNAGGGREIRSSSSLASSSAPPGARRGPAAPERIDVSIRKLTWRRFEATK